MNLEQVLDPPRIRPLALAADTARKTSYSNCILNHACVGLKHVSLISSWELRHTVHIKVETQHNLYTLWRICQGHWTSAFCGVTENEILWERQISTRKETDRASVLQMTLGKSSAEILFPLWVLAHEIIVFEVGNYHICMFRLCLFLPCYSVTAALFHQNGTLSSQGLKYLLSTKAYSCQKNQNQTSKQQQKNTHHHHTLYRTSFLFFIKLTKSKFIPGKEQQN